MTQRNIVTCVILTLVTCGIYGIYWFVMITNESNELSPEFATASGGMAVLFEIITCSIYKYYWAYKMGQKMDAAKGASDGSNAILYLVLSIFALDIVVYALVQNTMNQLA